MYGNIWFWSFVWNLWVWTCTQSLSRYCHVHLKDYFATKIQKEDIKFICKQVKISRIDWLSNAFFQIVFSSNCIVKLICNVLRRERCQTFWYIVYSPKRGSGSWTSLRRSPPRWGLAGRRQNNYPCSRRASACSCAWWTASRTAPAHACRSRGRDTVKEKREQCGLDVMLENSNVTLTKINGLVSQ